MAASTWPYWQHQLLYTAGLPSSDFNVSFLTRWNVKEPDSCSRNPVQISHRVGGSTRCKQLPNGRYARNYASRDDAANAFAAQLNLTDYPNLREALASGDPGGYDHQDGLLLDLQKWGSVNYQRDWAETGNLGTVPGGNSPKPTVTTKNVSGAWTNLMRTLARDGHQTIVELGKSTAIMHTIERRLRRL